jgi:multiple sugar transport system permease protein
MLASPPVAPIAQEKRRRRRSGQVLYKSYTPYLLSAPAILIVIVVLILPMFFAIYLSFTDASLLSFAAGKYKMIGLDNYKNFLFNESFGKVWKATFIYVLLGVSLTYIIGLLTALLLNQNFRTKALFRGIIILPWIIPQVVLVLIWRWMLNPKYGVINVFLEQLGLIEANFSWFSTASVAIFALMLVTIWKQYPLANLILLAGLKAIPTENYEAAVIDGANTWQRFWYITLPGLRYVTSVLLMLLTIWSFTNFTIIWVLTKGGPSDTTATLSIYTYLNAFKFQRMGLGASIGVISLLITLLFAIIYYLIFMKKQDTM